MIITACLWSLILYSCLGFFFFWCCSLQSRLMLVCTALNLNQGFTSLLVQIAVWKDDRNQHFLFLYLMCQFRVCQFWWAMVARPRRHACWESCRSYLRGWVSSRLYFWWCAVTLLFRGCDIVSCYLQYFHPDHMSSAEKMKLELQRVRDESKISENDCGSARVQGNF